MTYTLQSKLDRGHFGARWGCYFTGPINAGEYIRQRPATEDELDAIIGKAFRTLAASMSNYKHDGYVRPRSKPPAGWDAKSNPEWHYLIENYTKMLHIVSEKMNIDIDPRRFEIAIMKTVHGTHYCIRVDKVHLINPDPALNGIIEKYIPMG